jgi:hypothetical protein
MKESEFIELLNLYIDHEISAEDAVRLEAEVVSDPKRRQVYRQYCQMHKACAVLADQFSEQATPQCVVEKPSRNWTGTFYSVGFAAAACLAIFLAVRHHEPISKERSVASTVSPKLQQNFQQVAYQQPNLQPIVALRDLTLTPTQVSNSNPQLPNDTLAWMQQLQLQQVQMQMQLQAMRQMQTPAGLNVNQLRVMPVALPVELTPSYLNQPEAQVQNAAFHFER